MLAAVLKQQKKSLVIEEVPRPTCGTGELLVKVLACGVCRTDLHILEGDLPAQKLPLILGHEIMGVVEDVGPGVSGYLLGDTVGIPWLAKSCGSCSFCDAGKENLCDQAEFTGYHRDGGFAEYTTCRADFAIPFGIHSSPMQTAPFLCAGLIGYRAYRMAFPEKTLGLYGFGAAAHLLAQLAIAEGKEVYAFTRVGDREGQRSALALGAVWAGDSTMIPPEPLDAAILFAPVGELIPLSLKALKKGGRCICGGIHMTDIPSFPYRDLWGEKTIQSVANLTRKDAREYFTCLSKISIVSPVTVYSLSDVNRALLDLKEGHIQGAAVIQICKK